MSLGRITCARPRPKRSFEGRPALVPKGKMHRQCESSPSEDLSAFVEAPGTRSFTRETSEELNGKTACLGLRGWTDPCLFRSLIL